MSAEPIPPEFIEAALADLRAWGARHALGPETWTAESPEVRALAEAAWLFAEAEVRRQAKGAGTAEPVGLVRSLARET